MWGRENLFSLDTNCNEVACTQNLTPNLRNVHLNFEPQEKHRLFIYFILPLQNHSDCTVPEE